MADQVLGRGIIEVVGDARKLKASVDVSKKSIRGLGKTQKDASKGASRSINRYITKLKQQNATVGKSRREMELYKLALRGASNAQIKAANSALLLQERQVRTAAAVRALRIGFIAIAAAGAVFGRFIKSTIDAQDELSKLSQKLNISVEDLAGLQHAGELAGVSNEKFTKGIKSVSSQLFDAANGLLESKRNFEALDIAVRNSDGSLRNATDVIIEVADKFLVLEDSTEKTALATKLFGKAGLDLIPLLNEGSAAIAAMVAEGQKLNPVTAESAKQSEIFNDNLTRLKGSVSKVGINITNDLIGPLSRVSTIFADASVNSGNFWETLIGTTLNYLSGDTATTREQIKSVRAEIVKSQEILDAHKESFFPALFADDIAILEFAIKGKEARLTALQAQLGSEQAAIFIDPGLTKPAPFDKPKIEDAAEVAAREAAAKAALGRQNAFNASLDKQVALLGKSAVEIKVYEAALLGIKGPQLEDVRLRAQRVEDFNNEQSVLETMRNSYADASNSYLEFLNKLKEGEVTLDQSIERQELELSLVGKTAQERTLALATYDAEQRAKERLIELNNLLEVGDRASIEAAKQREIEANVLSGQIERQSKEMEQLDQFGVQAARNLQTAFANFLFDPFDKGLDGMLIAFSDILKRMIAEAAAAQILKAIFGANSSGGADIFGGLLSIGSSLFSGLSFGGSAIGTAGGGSSSFASQVKGFTGLTHGGIHKGGLRLVGESGPELEVTPPSRIFNNQDTREMLKSASGHTITYSPVIQIDSRTDQREVETIVERAVLSGNADFADKLERAGKI